MAMTFELKQSEVNLLYEALKYHREENHISTAESRRLLYLLKYYAK